MDSLFSESADKARRGVAPLAARMRPRNLGEYVGQDDVVGPGTVLRSAIESDNLTSLILYGPAGTGKTSLARVIANTSAAHFSEVSAVSSGVKDLRASIEAAEDRLAMSGARTILFIDEIHRFSKSQQDALLHAVEDRLVVLVGATTENPFFEVNAPLISRSRVVELNTLTDANVRTILRSALVDERGLVGDWRIEPDAEEHIVVTAGGDARVALTTLELAAQAHEADDCERRVITLSDVERSTLVRPLSYDKDGDVHYDVTSAFIKSMRGGDPDASVYWLARMIHGGEDPRFIARRIMILAAEDVGNADPNAVLVAHAAVKATEFIGLPECRINLAQAAVYMALAPKSNASYLAIDSALEEVTSGPARAVPNHLRDRSYKGAKVLGRGEGYRYPHSFEGANVDQQYLPDGLVGRRFFDPTDRGWEGRRTAPKEVPDQ
ncbi:MAG: replication-associated recombination protein A [Actinomycetota bacterium]|nr:replication-associated recombination protein A [Actinomycetota bacterium]